MARLIDKDALVEAMVRVPLRSWNTKTLGEVLDALPDPITRCCECQHWDKDSGLTARRWTEGRKMQEKLKPCPFCGQRKSLTMVTRYGTDGWRDRYCVLCDYEEGGCGSASGWYHSKAEAAYCWNTRKRRQRDGGTEG